MNKRSYQLAYIVAGMMKPLFFRALGIVRVVHTDGPHTVFTSIVLAVCAIRELH